MKNIEKVRININSIISKRKMKIKIKSKLLIINLIYSFRVLAILLIVFYIECKSFL